MQRSRLWVAAVLAMGMLACNLGGQVSPPASPTATTAPAPTTSPTSAAPTQIPPGQTSVKLSLAVQAADGTISLVAPADWAVKTFKPAFNGLLPRGGSAAGTAYVLDLTSLAKAYAVDSSGSRELGFIKGANYGLAVWPGNQGNGALLAWGTGPGPDVSVSNLQMSQTDGSGLVTLQTEDTTANPPRDLVAELWSGDGQNLFFSKEPVGIGGYIPFPGASSLYKEDLTSKQVTEIIPFDPSGGPFLCLDALSPDQRYVADHCGKTTITLRNLTDATQQTIQPPTGVSGYSLVGSARFSPDGSQVAYALAKGNPSDELGWVAVYDAFTGASKVVLTGQAGGFYNVAGWLDDQTLLVQFDGISCGGGCSNSVWVVPLDGSTATKVADGTFLSIVQEP